MGKPILERIKRPSWWGDQALHALVGCAITTAWAATLAYGVGINPAIAGATGVLVSATVAAVRELIQNLGDAPDIGSQDDALLDTYFWHVGTAIGVLSLLWA